MSKDKIFNKEFDKTKDFEFNQDVANVFDDMVSRSVPIYNEIHKIINDIARRYLPNNAIIYDLGCSTGTTIVKIQEILNSNNKKASFIGIDNSESMLKKCSEKLKEHEVPDYKLEQQDLENLKLKQSDFIIMNYTLQFLTKEKRQGLIKKIYSSLKPGGFFILSEKIISPSKKIDDILVDLYYDFKRRNGYSELEISQKREALENVLKPLTPKEQLNMLYDSGFKDSELVFRWYNFACYLGLKN